MLTLLCEGNICQATGCSFLDCKPTPSATKLGLSVQGFSRLLAFLKQIMRHVNWSEWRGHVLRLSENYLDALPCADLDVAIIWPLVRAVPGETEPLPATIQSTSGPTHEVPSWRISQTHKSLQTLVWVLFSLTTHFEHTDSRVKKITLLSRIFWGSRWKTCL